MKCKQSDCGCEAKKRGYCPSHYERLRRAGRLPNLPRTTPEERFWGKVDRTGGCWLWTGAKSTWGYGQFFISGRRVAAHRWSYEIHTGVPIPDGVLLDHICHVPACVNPSHLRPVTNKQNAEHRLGAQANSKSRVRGVNWHSKTGRWVARVQHHGRRYAAGYFVDLNAANEAAVALRNQLFTHNDHDPRPQHRPATEESHE